MMDGLTTYLNRTVLGLTQTWIRFALKLWVLFFFLDPWTIPHNLPLVVAIRVSLISLAYLSLKRLSERPPEDRHANKVAMALAAAFFAVAGLYYILFGDPYFDIYVQMLLIANGMLFLSWKPILVTGVLQLASWLLIHQYMSDPLGLGKIGIVIAAGLIGYHGYKSRRRVITDQWQLQNQETWLHQELLGALKSAETAKALLSTEMTQTSLDINQAVEKLLTNREQRRRLHSRLLHANRLSSLGRLAAGLAHRLNNKLLVLMGTLELMSHNAAPIDEECFVGIRSALERSASLTERLLPLTGSHHLRLKKSTVPELLSKFLPLMKRTDSELQVHLGKIDGSLFVDPDAWFQIISNLIRNADEVTPTERHIHLYMSQAGSEISFSVHDGGPGIPHEYREKIFQPFFTTKGNKGGTGLGLSIALGLVEQMQGSLDLSESEGGGAAFTVSFEAVPEEVVSETPQIALREEFRWHGCKVLVVEDDAEVRSTLQTFLERMGLTVVTASDGQEGLSAYEREPVKLVISDVVMPTMDGPTLVKELWKKNPEIRVLFTSGYSDKRLAESGLQNSKFDFLAKPYSLDTLARHLNRVLS